jgi:disulfide oxidoreductase YuzD
MEENQNKNLLKKLLDRLQEDSWQLELLVSGFTIFGLFYAFGPVQDAFDKAVNEGDMLCDVYQIVLIAISILILNLIIHVILRSLWIGALGLRYLSGEVEIDKLNYDARFTVYLKKKIGSFDDYIEKLEKLCSVIFAISFLLIFYVIAAVLVVYLVNFVGSSSDTSTFLYILRMASIFFLLVGAVLTLFDYLTQGLLKKNKWVASVYFPFYWVFSYLTLSFLYRPLYYNLIDNKFGRRVSFLLLPFYLSVLFISNIYKEQSRFITYSSITSNAIRANSQNYEDLVEKNDLFISALTIQSKIICDPFIKVKIPISKYIEDNIMDFNESLRPYQDKNLYKSTMDLFGSTIESTFKGNTDSLHLEFMKSFQDIYSIKIDSIPYKLDFVIVDEDDRKNPSIGFETYIGTNNLTEGKHVLVYSRYKHPNTDSIITIREIPFWYYKD